MSEPQKTKPSLRQRVSNLLKARMEQLRSMEVNMGKEQSSNLPQGNEPHKTPGPQGVQVPEENEKGKGKEEQKEIEIIIKNQTARRIGISPIKKQDDQLIIPPFGSIIVGEKMLKEYEKIDTWEKRNLITKEESPTIPKDEVSYGAAFGCLWAVVYIIFLIICVSKEIISKYTWEWRPTFGIGTGVFIGIPLIVIIYSWVRKRDDFKQYWQWFSLLPSLVLVLAIGLGIPTAVIYFFGGGLEVLAQTGAANLFVLGRVLQLGFVSIASILPALMYFLFGRQQREKLRDNFIREVMMLDPNIQTISEAKTKYNPLFDSVYADKTPLDSIPIYFSTILITFGWIMTLLPIGQTIPLESRALVDLFTPHITALNFGFLGAYFFSINLVFRRYVRADITTKTYTYITIRLLVTAILVWVVSSLPGLLSGETGIIRTGTLILAFFIGVFPETGTAVMQDFYRRAFGPFIKSLEEDHPLTNLEGINLYDRARLLEEGIENIENLAHHNLLELVVKTHIPTPRIVDMFDQAILYTHLGLDSTELLKTRQMLRTYGIRTATDLQQVMDHLPNLLKEEMPTLANRLGMIERALSDDEWMEYLKQWKSATSSIDVLTLDDFIKGRSMSSQPKDSITPKQVNAS